MAYFSQSIMMTAPHRKGSGTQTRARRAIHRPRGVPFMALLVATVTAFSVTAGFVNRHIEQWAMAWSDVSALEQVEYISAKIMPN